MNQTRDPNFFHSKILSTLILTDGKFNCCSVTFIFMWNISSTLGSHLPRIETTQAKWQASENKPVIKPWSCFQSFGETSGVMRVLTTLLHWDHKLFLWKVILSCLRGTPEQSPGGPLTSGGHFTLKAKFHIFNFTVTWSNYIFQVVWQKYMPGKH